MKTATAEATRQAQRKYRLKQRAKLEDYQKQVEDLKARLSELDLKRAGLASQNKVLEEAAAAVEARNEREAVAVEVEKQKVWDERTGKCLAEFVNHLRADSLLVEVSVEEGRKLSVSELLVLLKEFYRQVSDVLASTVPENVKSRHLNRLITAKGEARRAFEFMGPKYAAILTLGFESSEKALAGSIPTPGLEAARRGLEMINLSEDQKHELLTGRNRLLRRYGEIKEERIRIIQRMHDVIERDRAEGDQQTSAMLLLEEVNAMDELKRNLNQEHTCFHRFQAEIHDTLSTIQFAKALAMRQMDQVSIWTLMQHLAAQEAAKRGLILANNQSQACDFLDAQSGHSHPQDMGGGVTAPTSAFAPATVPAQTSGFGATPQQVYQQPSGIGALLGAQTASQHEAISRQPRPDASSTAAPERLVSQTYHQPSNGYSQAEVPVALAPESAQGTESHHSPTEYDFEMLDDVLLDMPDPFGPDFAGTPDGEDGPLWKLVQDLSSDQQGGKQQMGLQQA